MDVIGPKVTELTLIRADFWISNPSSVGPFVVVSFCPTRDGVVTSVRRIERRKRSARSWCVGHICTRHEEANVSAPLSKKGRATGECAFGASAVAQLSREGLKWICESFCLFFFWPSFSRLWIFFDRDYSMTEVSFCELPRDWKVRTHAISSLQLFSLFWARGRLGFLLLALSVRDQIFLISFFFFFFFPQDFSVSFLVIRYHDHEV